MTAPRTCESCGAALDAGEVCDCRKDETGALIRVTQLPVIEEQLRTVKDRVDASVEQALALVCNEETLAAVKNTRADIGRQFKELEDMRKAVKKAVMGPYERFEAVYRECVSDAFRRADADLKGKIDATEQEIKQRCEDGLREYFAELCEAEHLDFLRFEQTGVRVDLTSAKQKTPKKLREQLAAFVADVSRSVDLIATMDNADEIMVEFKRTLNAPEAIGAVQERHRRMEAERAAQEARKAAQEREQAAVEKVEAAAPPEPVAPPTEPEKVYQCVFTVHTTIEKLKKLKEFMDQEGIRYE